MKLSLFKKESTMTTLNIGDAGHITSHQKIKRIRITGYWKFKPFSPCEDEFTEKVLSELIEKDIADGIRRREERIEPCSKKEAQLVGTNSNFFDVNDVELDPSYPPVDVEFYKEQHRHRLEIMQQHGEMGVYGRIKLPVEQHPRFFDSKGNLLPEFEA